MFPSAYRRFFLFPFVLALVGAALYLNSLNNSFHYDDNDIIVKNTKIYEISRAGEFFTSPLFSDIGGYTGYRPLLMLSFALNYHFSGPNPAHFRIVNLIFHILNAFCVFFLVLGVGNRLFQGLAEDELFAAAALSSMLFLVHPVNAIAVNFIWKRSTLMCTFFVLCALIWFVHFHLRKFYGEDRGKLYLRIASLAVMNVFFLSALLSKETAVVFPLALILIFVFFTERGRLYGFAADISPSIVLAALFVWFRLNFIHGLLREMNYAGYISEGILAPTEYSKAQLIAVTRYIKLLLFPDGLNIYHEVIVPESFFAYPMLVRAGFLLSLAAMSFVFLKRVKWFSFGALWFFIFLIPTSTVLRLNILMDEIRVYASLIGYSVIFAFAVLLLYRFFGSKRGKMAALAIVGVPASLAVLLYGFNTMMRNTFYKNELILWVDSVEKSPKTFFPRLYLGKTLKNLGYMEEAKKEIEEALKIKPESSIAKVYLGSVYQNIGDNEKAVKIYEKLLDERVMNYYAHLNLGMIYKNMDKKDKALYHLYEACKIDNMGFEAFRETGKFLHANGDHKNSLLFLRRAYEINPFDIETLNSIGFLYHKHLNDERLALQYFKESLRINEKQPLIMETASKIEKSGSQAR